MFIILGLYSIIGAIIFCALEAKNERSDLRDKINNLNQQSNLARNRLLYDLQYFFVKEVNFIFKKNFYFKIN